MNAIQTLAIAALPVIFAITFHEAAHGYVARYFGDLTAFQQGRISLNPIRHIDPIGTILLPMVTMLLGGFLFGWAKPVPVDASHLHRPKQDMLWVAAAGPGANLLMALAWALLLKLALGQPDFAFAEAMAEMGRFGRDFNIVLMLLNLIPLLPLDGGRIVHSLLPARAGWKFSQIEPYGLVIVLLLLFTHALDFLLWPMVGWFQLLIKNLFGL